LHKNPGPIHKLISDYTILIGVVIDTHFIPTLDFHYHCFM